MLVIYFPLENAVFVVVPLHYLTVWGNYTTKYPFVKKEFVFYLVGPNEIGRENESRGFGGERIAGHEGEFGAIVG